MAVNMSKPNDARRMALGTNPVLFVTITNMYGRCTMHAENLGGGTRYVWRKADGGRVSIFFASASDALAEGARVGTIV